MRAIEKNDMIKNNAEYNAAAILARYGVLDDDPAFADTPERAFAEADEHYKAKERRRQQEEMAELNEEARRNRDRPRQDDRGERGLALEASGTVRRYNGRPHPWETRPPMVVVKAILADWKRQGEPLHMNGWDGDLFGENVPDPDFFKYFEDKHDEVDQRFAAQQAQPRGSVRKHLGYAGQTFRVPSSQNPRLGPKIVFVSEAEVRAYFTALIRVYFEARHTGRPGADVRSSADRSVWYDGAKLADKLKNHVAEARVEVISHIGWIAGKQTLSVSKRGELIEQLEVGARDEIWKRRARMGDRHRGGEYSIKVPLAAFRMLVARQEVLTGSLADAVKSRSTACLKSGPILTLSLNDTVALYELFRTDTEYRGAAAGKDAGTIAGEVARAGKIIAMTLRTYAPAAAAPILIPFNRRTRAPSLAEAIHKIGGAKPRRSPRGTRRDEPGISDEHQARIDASKLMD